MLVPTVRTICTHEEFCEALIKAWQKLFNYIPKKQSICVIMGQHQLETGGKNTWGWNFGNIKYVKSNGDVDYQALNGVWEIVNGKKIILTKDDPGSWFRAFKTIDEGALFYLQFVSGKRYRKAWEAIVAGDPKQFCHLLKVAGYYTADETQYTNSVMAYFNKYMKEAHYEKAIEKLKLSDKPVNSVVVVANTNSEAQNTLLEPIKPISNFTIPETVIAAEDNEPIKLNWIQSILNFIMSFFKKR